MEEMNSRVDEIGSGVGSEVGDFSGELSNEQCAKLADMVMMFAEEMIGFELYPYEREFGWRICYSVIIEDAEEITALFSRQSGKTETVATVVDALMVLLPVFAKVLSSDSRLLKFRNGFWVGIYAPGYEQSEIMFDRMKARMYSKASMKILLDPDIDIDLLDAPKNMELPNGSFAHCGTAAPQASIEGKTFHLIIFEECVGPESLVTTPDGDFPIVDLVENSYSGKVRAFSHDKNEIVWADVLGVLEIEPRHQCFELTFSDNTVHRCTGDHRWFIEGVGYVSTYQLYTLAYFSYNNSKLGVDSDTNRSNAIRNSIRRWLSELPGQEILEKSAVCDESFYETDRICEGEAQETEEIWCRKNTNSKESRKRKDVGSDSGEMSTRTDSISRSVLSKGEERSISKNSEFPRQRRSSLVVDGRRPCKYETEYGSVIDERFHQRRDRDDFQLVCNEMGSKFCSAIREQIDDVSIEIQGKRFGDAIYSNQGLRIRFYDAQSNTYERGGMRHLSKDVCSKEDKSTEPVLFIRMQEDKKEGIRLIKIQGIESPPKVYDLKTSEGNFFVGNVLTHNCQDISSEKIRASIHPMASATAGTLIKIGTCSPNKSDFYEACRRNQRNDVNKGLARSKYRAHFQYDYTVAQRYNPRYRKYVEKEKERLGEDSDEFKMKYRLIWMLERGMYVSPDMLDECGVKTSNDKVTVEKGKGRRKKVFTFTRSSNVTTYDPLNSDICAAIDVGRENSTVVTVAKVFWECPVLYGDEDRYFCHVYNWLELVGDQHEAQWPQILEFLDNYLIGQVIVDATGKGDPVYSRLAAELDSKGITVTPFLFSSQSKDVGYKVLLQELTARRMTFPAGSRVTRMKKYQRFYQQMCDLEKRWRGQTMVVEKPRDVQDAHDDYPDSLMMLCWLVNVRGSMEVETAPNMLLGRMSGMASNMATSAREWYRKRVSTPRRVPRPSHRGRWDS